MTCRHHSVPFACVDEGKMIGLTRGFDLQRRNLRNSSDRQCMLMHAK